MAETGRRGVQVGRRKPVIQGGPAGRVLSGSPAAGFWLGLPVRGVRRQLPLGKTAIERRAAVERGCEVVVPATTGALPDALEKVAQRTDQWRVSGDEPERFVGSSRPSVDGGDGQLSGGPPAP